MQELFLSLKTHYDRLSLYLSLDSARRHVGEKIKTFYGYCTNCGKTV